MEQTNSGFSHKFFLILGLILVILLIGVPQFGFSQESPEEGDAFLEEDPVAEEGDAFLQEDPLDEEAEAPLDSPPDTAQQSPAEETLLDKIEFSHQYTIKAEALDANRGFSLGENPAEEESLALYNTYQLLMDLQANPRLSYHVELQLEHEHDHDRISEKGTSEFTGTTEAAYVRYRSGAHLLTVGDQQFEIGTLDSSPIDILNQSEDRFSSNITPKVYYRWGAHPFSVHLYWNPIYRPTEAQAETIEKNNGVDDDRPFIRSYYGIRLGYAAGAADIKLGVFRWFDRDSKLSTTFTITPPQTLDGTTIRRTETFEEESEVEFATFEMDWSFGNYVWRVETVLFQNKNVYDFKVLTDKQITAALQTIPPPAQVIGAEVNTLELDQVVFATTLERIVDDLIIMPGVLFRQIQDVPENTQIAYYENERTPKTDERNVERTDVSLFVKYEFNEDFNTTFKAINTSPFFQSQLSNEWKWHSWKFKIVKAESERLFVTNEKLKNNSVSVSYRFEF